MIGTLKEIRQMCESDEEWYSLLNQDSHLASLVRRWQWWLTKFERDGTIPIVWFDEQELNYINSAILDTFKLLECCSKTEAFVYMCELGQLEACQWLFQRLDRQMDLRVSFDSSCWSGNREIAEWLLQLDPSLTVCQKTIFRVCIKGDISMMDWLLKQYPPSESQLTHIFNTLCVGGKLDKVELLHSRFPLLNIRNHTDFAFRWACRNGHLSVAKWIKEVHPEIDPRVGDDYAYKWALKQKRHNVTKWLKMLSPNIGINTPNDLGDIGTNMEDIYVLFQQRLSH